MHKLKINSNYIFVIDKLFYNIEIYFSIQPTAMIPTKKTIILNLIVEDLCLQQFLHGMENVGMQTSHEFHLNKILMGLLEHDPENIPEKWLSIYYDHCEKAHSVEYANREKLWKIALECFTELQKMDRAN